MPQEPKKIDVGVFKRGEYADFEDEAVRALTGADLDTAWEVQNAAIEIISAVTEHDELESIIGGILWAAAEATDSVCVRRVAQALGITEEECHLLFAGYIGQYNDYVECPPFGIDGIAKELELVRAEIRECNEEE